MKTPGKIQVRELKPENAVDYFRLFDEVYDHDSWLNFKENPGWGGCYCTFHDDPREEDAINESQDKRGDNKSARTRTIQSGSASGLLAYVDGAVAGWCNVAPRNSYANPRNVIQVGDDKAEKVGSITCFLVAEGYRGSGVASTLLGSATSLIGSWGFEVAEGYPRNPEATTTGYDIPDVNLQFRGSMNMFLKNGFHVHKKLDRMVLVRKPLR